jgi:ankyrin repeat protein
MPLPPSTLDARLEMAITGDFISHVTYALRAGANPNASSAYDLPFIIYAVHRQRNGCAEILKHLVAAGADITARDQRAQNALMIACSQGKASLITTLLNLGSPLDAVDEDGWSALMLASCCSRYSTKDCVLALIEAGCNVNFSSVSGKNTALMLFTYKCQPEVVEALLKAGARTDVRDSSGRRPSDIASALSLKPSANYHSRDRALDCLELIKQAERVHDAEVDLEIMVAPAAAPRSARRL